ncbi:MAG: dihydrolipoyl dehydrogenase family protein [Methanosarcina flavescens]|jgi:glutathione reductase (NADPH)|uniref:NAD(P)/FAD-dependent oxidoreductase n=1 Tax=Methanosarcina flavescens TaxID=1715806 RepID=A0A660HRK6_9EURY|nr:NAD(P)/FAD-dependent oxidoreductase [Methanosarcina flavescens]AYK14910.1 NAD(P)/FAD-dependent oxidoreductase [Methanosarcina flavescens]NLK31653.1 NAD(P)/FAD-dependent oxidoreductase [Methanosarcina flavescens]
MENKYDIIIIGTGTAGRTFAGKVSHSGLKIAIIDSRKYGGTCPLRGCDPKKVLIDITEVVDSSNRFVGKGVGTDTSLTIDWASLIEFKRTFTEEYPTKIEKRLVEMGIDTYHGRAYFENQNTIVVGEDKLKGEYIFLATGAKPRKLNIPGEEYITTSEGLMETKKLPERIIFIGGGYISMEFAHVVRRAGAEVIILHRSEKILKNFDPDIVDMLIKASEAAGIKILTNKPVISVEKENNGLLVRVKSKTETGSETQTFRADMVVHGAGRVADIEDLQLEKAGVKIEKGAIVVDKFMKTSNPRIYAGGDCALEGVQLTPVATLQGIIAAINVLEGDSIEADYTGIPSAVFTIPVMASVGISAPKDSDKYKVIFQDRSSWNTTRRAGIKFAASKVIIDEANDRIMGAHILGPHAGEAINIFAAVMRLGLRASDIKKLIFSYPTTCSDIPYML